MKHTYYLLLLVSILFMCSCSKQSIQSIETYSPDKEMKITLNGSRTNALDSWLLEIELDYMSSKSKVYQEFYADEVTKNNVSFEWKSNTACLIHLTQRDGVAITVPVKISKR